MKTAYLTGATGCIGRNLVDELLKDKWRVIVLHRKSSNLRKLDGVKVEFRCVDLHSFDSVKKTLNEKAQALFHVAANVSDWPKDRIEQRMDNVVSTRNLVAASLENSCVERFILCSTGAVTRCGNDAAEQVEQVRSGYIKTKRLSEIEVQRGIESGLDAVILRPIIVVGKYDYNNYSQIFSYLKNSPIKLVFPGKLWFCHAGDVARAHIQAYEKGRRGEIYYLGGEYISWYDFFCKISAIIGTKPPFKPLPYWAYYALSYCQLWISYLTNKKPQMTPELIDLVRGDSDNISDQEFAKAERELGYKSAPVNESLRDCYRWLIEEEMLG